MQIMVESMKQEKKIYCYRGSKIKTTFYFKKLMNIHVYNDNITQDVVETEKITK